jgi:hypothetical protein
MRYGGMRDSNVIVGAAWTRMLYSPEELVTADDARAVDRVHEGRTKQLCDA